MGLFLSFFSLFFWTDQNKYAENENVSCLRVCRLYVVTLQPTRHPTYPLFWCFSNRTKAKHRHISLSHPRQRSGYVARNFRLRWVSFTRNFIYNTRFRSNMCVVSLYGHGQYVLYVHKCIITPEYVIFRQFVELTDWAARARQKKERKEEARAKHETYFVGCDVGRHRHRIKGR